MEQAVQQGGAFVSDAFVIGLDARQRRIRNLAQRFIVVDADNGHAFGGEVTTGQLFDFIIFQSATQHFDSMRKAVGK